MIQSLRLIRYGPLTLLELPTARSFISDVGLKIVLGGAFEGPSTVLASDVDSCASHAPCVVLRVTHFFLELQAHATPIRRVEQIVLLDLRVGRLNGNIAF